MPASAGQTIALEIAALLAAGGQSEVELRYPYAFPPADAGQFDGREADVLVL